MTPSEYRALRDELGLTQTGLAAEVGVTRKTVNCRETGAVRITEEAALAIRFLSSANTLERNAARQDRDEWKDSAARYHRASEWLDAERSKFISALRDIDPKHPLLPENSQINE